MTEEKSEGALSGIRVVDLTRVLAGPFCTMNLGDMGAEIIKIERPGSGDDTRGWGPPFAGTEAAYFLGVNRNKRSVTLDLKDPRGLDILKKMLTQADVLIENFKIGTLDRWGITAEWLEQNAPQVVHCQITGYGDRGPKGGMPGYDFLLQAESGLMSISGEVEGGPMKIGVAIVDVCTGMYAAMCITAALNARTRTGRGQKVSVTLFDTSLSVLVNVASNYLISTKVPGRFGNGHPNIVPYREFPCGEGEIALAVGNDGQFAQLAKAVDHPEWADDDRFKINANRVHNRDTIDGLIQEALVAKSAEDWITQFVGLGIPCSMVNTVEEALESEQAKANEMVAEIEHPTAGLIRMLGIPYQFSDTKEAIQSAPPVLGADTDDVLKEQIGLNEDEISALRSDGVV
ncbi:MAG: CoA transferase [Rhodospirillales bacterium]|jgi:succinate---hydroxymethylglutarate CoA-transferase|nr:CoA transferase [Rhodospirillales bacterium]MBT8001495.1 CoA transferase [Rhodospirillales bacterium]